MAARVFAHHWSPTELGPLADWPERTRAVVDLVLASPLVASVALGPKRRLIYNDAAARLYGDRHPGVLGQPLSEAFPDSYHAVKAFYDQVFGGEAVCVAAQPLAIAGQDEVFDAYLTPVRDDAGAVIGAHMVGLEIGRQARAEAALRESEARYRSIFASMADGFYLAEAVFDAEGTCVDLRYLDENAAAMRMTGQSFKGRRLSELGGYEPYWYEIFGDTARNGTPHDAELFAAPDGIWYSFHTFKPPGAGANELVVVFSDVTMQHELADSEAMRRIALSGGRMGSWRWDRAADLIRGDAQFMALWGLPPTDGALPLATFAARMTPAGATEMAEIVTKAVAAGEEFSGPLEIAAGPTAGHWVQWQGRAAAGDPAVLYGVTYDITEQKKAEARLRESEERQAFLLRLSDALRPLGDVEVIQAEAMRLLGKQLGVSRAQYYIADETGEYLSSAGGYTDGVAAAVGQFRLIEFGRYAYDGFHAGETQVVSDATTDPRISAEVLSSYQAVGFLAYIGVPFVQRGRLLGTVAVHQAEPRQWTEAERQMVEQTAERAGAAVEQARAEAALRASEQKHRDLFEKMEEGYLICDVIFEDGRAIDVEYVEANPAAILMIGVEVVGRRMRDVDPNYEEYWYELYGRVASSGITERDTRYAAPVDRWYDYRMAKVDPGDNNSRRVSVLFSDASARVSAELSLRESEERYRSLFESMDEAYAVVEVLKDDVGKWVDFRFLAVNPAFMVHTGMSYPVGQTATELLGTPNPRWTELYGQALDTSETLRVEESEATLGITFDLNIFALDCAHNRVAVLFTNITVRKEAERALRESEERQRLMVELVPALLWSADPDGQEITLNEGWSAYTGQREADTQDYGWLSAIHPADMPATRAAFEHAFATGEPLERQQRIHKGGDGYRWHLVRHIPVRDEHGVITRWFGAAVDIHDSKLAEQALQDTERRLQTLIEGVPQLVWRAVDGGHWTWASPQWTDYTGQAEPDSHDWGWLDPVHPDDRDLVKNVWAGAIERGEFHADYRLCHAAEGRYRWFQTRATAVRDDDGTIVEWLGTSTDVDDLRELQERQKVLVAELQHRTRNLIGVVRATADRTGEASADFADFRDRFRDRLEALARVQGLLSRLNETDRIAFDELIRTELTAMSGAAERVTLDGPSGVRLRSSMVQTLAMALHELATNAVKYGALGQPDGHLAISWRMVEPDRRGRPRLSIEWQESGVTMPPPGAAPQGGGQGRELIEQALPYQLNAETSFELGPDGVRCTIIIPVSTSTPAETIND